MTEHSARAAAAAGFALALLLAGCASGPGRLGGDGAEANPPAGLDQVPSAEPREEAIRQSGGTSKPYTVLGRRYTPITDDRPWRERGLASWYGRQFHGQPTASGEAYDMYAMTAAHKTLPLPSYVRVRNPANGREAILRVNDRGPFHDGRIIDLSYTAALQLDLLRGVAPVEIERITNADIRTGAWRRADDAPRPQPVQPTLLAQATLPSDGLAPPATATLSDTAPPPRFGNMQTEALPPLAPLTPAPAPEPAPAPTPPPAGPATEPPAAAPAPSSATTRGIWLQLGAFREQAGAQDLQARAARSLPVLAPQLRVFSEADTHRLQAGPFASRDVANDMALQVRNGLGLVPMVVERR